jgi:hypothetical protein
VLGNYRLGAREREVIARSDVLMAVVYSQIEGFFDSVMDAPSPGLRAVDFGDVAGATGGTGIVERYRDGSISDSSASPRARARSSTSWRGSPGATGDSSS